MPNLIDQEQAKMRSKQTFVRACYAVAFAVAAALVPASIGAQETRGRITGRVIDTSKAAVPGASVEVKDLARGTSVTATTNAEGLFQANYLLPGAYEVSVQMSGFKRYVRS